jgi:hypothetical protein
MGTKWTARLRVDFEMEEGAFQRYIETGAIGKTGVKRGSAKVEIVAQGQTD